MREGESALKNFVREKIIEGKPGYDPKSFFEATRNIIMKILRENIRTKTKMILACKMEKSDLKSGNTINIDTTFHSEIETNLEGTEEEIFEKMVERIKELISNFQNNGSNWVFDRVIQLEIHFANWVPIKGSSYVPLPEKIAAKKAVINLKNEDEECFQWCVTRALNPGDHPERVSLQLREDSKKLNWSGLKFPVKLKDITIFEKANPEISVNVFGFEEEKVYPLKISKEKRNICVDLLLIEEHYCLIKNLSRLLSGVTKHDGTKEFCRNCLNHFPKNKLEIHEKYCFQNESVKIELPKRGILKFQHYNRTIKVPLVVYADFEAFTQKISLKRGSSTEQYQKHQPSGFCYKIVGIGEKCVLYRAKGDENIGGKFVEMLEKDIRQILQKHNLS